MVEFISAKFDDYRVYCKKKDEMIYSLEETVLGLTAKVDKFSSLFDRQEQCSKLYFHTWCKGKLERRHQWN